MTRGVMAVVAVGMLLLSCGGGSSSKADFTMHVEREDGCDALTQYTIVASKPYDRGFGGRFDDAGKALAWSDVPSDPLTLDTTLQTQAGGSYAYTLAFEKAWLGSATDVTLTASCAALAAGDDACGHPDADYLDTAPEKPALLYGLATVNAVFTVRNECNWFSKVQLFQKQQGDGSGAAVYSLVGASDFANRRGMIYWHDPDALGQTQTLVVRLTEGGNKTLPDVPFQIMPAEGQRLDFEVGCDTGTAAVFVRLRADAKILCPSEASDTDGDADSESASVDGDEETATPDADTDSEPALDGDSESESDIPDGDSESASEAESETETSDTESPCEGLSDPDVTLSERAEDTLSLTASSAGASVYQTLNTDFSDGTYARLDGTAVGQELVFTFTTLKPYTYRFMLTLVGGADGWGVVSFFVDDSATPLVTDGDATTYDLNFPYSSTTSDHLFNQLVRFGSVCLTPGMHTLRMRVVGSNSGGYKAGLDHFYVTTR